MLISERIHGIETMLRDTATVMKADTADIIELMETRLREVLTRLEKPATVGELQGLLELLLIGLAATRRVATAQANQALSVADFLAVHRSQIERTPQP